MVETNEIEEIREEVLKYWNEIIKGEPFRNLCAACDDFVREFDKFYKELCAALSNCYKTFMAQLYCPKCGAKGYLGASSTHFVICKECNCRSKWETVFNFYIEHFG